MRMKLKEERWKEKKEGKDEEAFTILQANTPTPTQKQKQNPDIPPPPTLAIRPRHDFRRVRRMGRSHPRRTHRSRRGCIHGIQGSIRPWSVRVLIL